MTKLVYLTNADTELLALRSIWERLPYDFPDLVARHVESLADLDGIVEDSAVIVVRLLGGASAYAGFQALVDLANLKGVPLLAFSGEATLDEAMTQVSTVPLELWRLAYSYLLQGGLENFENFLRLLADEFVDCRLGYGEVVEVPESGTYASRGEPSATVKVAVLFYRAHLISGNTTFIDDLLDSLDQAGAYARAFFTYSLRGNGQLLGVSSLMESLKQFDPDVVLSTVLAGGSLDEEERCWDAGEIASLNVPVVQGLISTQPRAVWESSDFGLSPIDVAMSVAIPEFDGRIIANTFAFKELIDEDLVFGASISAYRADKERSGALGRYCVRLGRLRHLANFDKRVAIVLSAYPTKRSRIGNAVGLDTPASAIAILGELELQGYNVGGYPSDSDTLMRDLSAIISYEDPTFLPKDGLTSENSMEQSILCDMVPSWAEGVKDELVKFWGEPPGSVYLSEGRMYFPGIWFGNALVCIQPPRGFGENPIAIYHSPELPPTYHYLAFYRWLDVEAKVDAVVHLGKHGTLEWLPGKSVGLSEECYSDLALGSLPLIYPFVINDPGEGTQAKRRAHAVLIGHLVPPMTRAESYGPTATLEALLDEHQRISALDPSKLPLIREEIWSLLEAESLKEEIGLQGDQDFHSSEFDSMVTDIDGYLCELKDALIRGGLHVFGQPPKGEALVDLVSAILRVDQGSIGSLRQTVASELAIDIGSMSIKEADLIEGVISDAVTALSECNWSLDAVERAPEHLRHALSWVVEWLYPRLMRTTDEIKALCRALDGGFIQPGPSGAPTRGMTNTLPTGRNFYSIDPRSLPTPISYKVGTKLAEQLANRYVKEHGEYPKSVGIVMWGTAGIRTGGDDVSEVLALLGVRPIWDESSFRIRGLEVIPLSELGRPRIDVTCRISGFFRDAFPHCIRLLEDAYLLVEGVEDEEPEVNFLKDSIGQKRIFGPPPRSYGAGILALLESQNWESDADIAEVYLTWGGYSYGREGFGLPARNELELRLAKVQVAAKNQDNREHDIFDSDDYFQEHGGMIAAIRHLSGRSPDAYFGDSSNPEHVKTRSIEEEAARVMRSRVLNPKWIEGMKQHGYKGAFEIAASVDYIFGYDATARVGRDWMYEGLTRTFVADEEMQEFFRSSNPTALSSICKRLLEAQHRGMWNASDDALKSIRSALLAEEAWEEGE